MCGIAGIFQLNGRPVPAGAAESMGRIMAHRGPDNFTVVDLPNVEIAHNRLSLIDLSAAANQPFRDADHVLAYNGEIYNYRELRKRLENEHVIEFKTTSDTEVLFYFLIHYGIECTLREIKGMFAFSFYNRHENRLFLARDRVGIKPLYYAQVNGAFCWASEVKAIAKTFELKPDPIKTLFSIGGIGENSSKYTLYNDILQVEPGTYLAIVPGGEPQKNVYYRPVDDIDQARYDDLDRKPSSEVVAEFESLFDHSVRSMLISDAPVGTFLSGGVDSSLISAMAKRNYGNIKLFTANVVGRYSEFDAARSVSRHIGAEIFDYAFESEMMLRDWADVTYFYESPIIVHTNALPFANVAGITRKHGVKAVLTGEGADELFLGYPRLLTKRFDKFAAAPVSAIRSLYRLVPGLHEYLFPNTKNSLTNFAYDVVRKFEPAASENGDIEKFSFLPEPKREEQYLTIKMLGPHLTTLLHRNDRMGMMASIEARFPFLHEDLVKFAVNLPVKYKIGRSLRWHDYKHPFLVDKWIVRKAAEKYLPRDISHKKKFGFGMYGHKFIRIKDGFFDGGWVGENLQLDRRSQLRLLETQDPYFIGKLASVEIFGRIFANGQDRADVADHIMRHAEMRMNE